jgi:hypothetical protein
MLRPFSGSFSALGQHGSSRCEPQTDFAVPYQARTRDPLQLVIFGFNWSICARVPNLQAECELSLRGHSDWRRRYGIYCVTVDLFPERRTEGAPESLTIAPEESLMRGRGGSSRVSDRPNPIQKGQNEGNREDDESAPINLCN